MTDNSRAIYDSTGACGGAPDGRILIAQNPQRSQQGSSLHHVIPNFASEVRNRLAAAKQ